MSSVRQPHPLADPSPRLLPLESGDRLTRDEFERRYHAMPTSVRAELIEGVVYVASPISMMHGDPHQDISLWLGYYAMLTPGARCGGEMTIRLDGDNEPQPDAHLRIKPSHGGRIRVSDDGYIVGAPELVAEVAISSVSYDLHDKLRAYRRNQVFEYLVWRVRDREFDWFLLREGNYERQAPGPDGLLRSLAFPGLWLDPAALLGDDMPRVLQVLQTGTATPEHAAFVAQLRDAAARRNPEGGAAEPP